MDNQNGQSEKVPIVPDDKVNVRALVEGLYDECKKQTKKKPKYAYMHPSAVEEYLVLPWILDEFMLTTVLDSKCPTGMIYVTAEKLEGSDGDFVSR